MLVRDKLFIGGQWVAPSGKETIDVHNAGNGEVMGRIPASGEKDAAASVAAARAALAGWSSTPVEKRAEFLQKISDGLKARADELAKLIAQEVGMPIKLAGRIQAGLPIANFANYAKLVKDFKFEERVGNSLVVREPVGVVVAITPWNYPLHQIALKVAPALAAGCTVVLKPSEVAPFNAFLLAEVIEAAGLPKGVFNLVTGYGAAVGEALVRNPDVDMISFTGSTRAGKRISELAAQGVKRVALELGGKSPAIVGPDFDLRTAAGLSTYRAFMNEAADLVTSYGGSLSGEHGDGQSRGELLPRMFSPRLMQAFREFKAIWDPDWRMNPGKVVSSRPLDENLTLRGWFPLEEYAAAYQAIDAAAGNIMKGVAASHRNAGAPLIQEDIQSPFGQPSPSGTSSPSMKVSNWVGSKEK